MQNNFLTEQRAVIQANSKAEREGFSFGNVIVAVGGALAAVGGIAITVVSATTLSELGVPLTIAGVSTAAGAIGSIVGGVALVGAGGIAAYYGVHNTVEGLSR